LEIAGLVGLGLVGSWVKGNEAELFLDLSYDLSPGGDTSLLGDVVSLKEFDHVVGDGSSRNEVLQDGVWDGETLIHGHCMGDTISGVADNTGGPSVGVEGQHSLDGYVKALDIVGLEHDLSHLFSVGLWVGWGLSEEDLVFTWVDSELVLEAVFPDLLHLLPLGDDTGLDWVTNVENTSHLLGLVSNVAIFGFDTNHLILGSWLSNDGWELDAWLVVSGETCLDHTGSVIDNNTLLV